MTAVGLISDTHGILDPRVFEYFKDCDEIWHAGDFGSVELSDQLAAFKPLKGVFGNIDDHALRKIHPLDNWFTCEQVSVWITHIGGYPEHYSPRVKQQLTLKAPDLFICGHSHILRVMRDKRYGNMLTMNPGAAGHHGFHKIRTLLRFKIDKTSILDAEVIELGTRGSQ